MIKRQKVKPTKVRQLPKGVKRIKRVGDKKHDLTEYRAVKAASGNSSLDCNDEVARDLRGKTLPEVYKIAAKVLHESERSLRLRYKDLNPGMQRMNLGNRLRGGVVPE